MNIGILLGVTILGVGCNEKEASEVASTVPVKEAPSQMKKKEKGNKPEKETSQKEIYKMQAESLISAIGGETSVNTIAEMSEELTKTGLSMLPSLISMNPACTEYLGVIQEIGSTLHTLPLEEIETGYHADGKLPKVSSAECYHGKDLVVHPATVTALAKAGLEDREKAKHEIEEVLEHLDAVHLVK